MAPAAAFSAPPSPPATPSNARALDDVWAGFDAGQDLRDLCSWLLAPTEDEALAADFSGACGPPWGAGHSPWGARAEPRPEARPLTPLRIGLLPLQAPRAPPALPSPPAGPRTPAWPRPQPCGAA